MKKKILLLLIFLLISALAYFGYKGVKKQIKNKEITEKIQNLPKFSFSEINGKIFNSNEIQNDLPLVITFFHPECEHCQYEIKEIVLNNKAFQNVNFVMISGASASKTKEFSEDYHLEKMPKLFLLRDPDFQFDEIFGKASYPTTLIYNKNHKLVEKIIGEVKVKKIIELLE